MAVEARYRADVEAILSHRHDNGGDLWATSDFNMLKGAPFSTEECARYLLELGMEPGEPLLQDVAALLFSAWRPDGRFKMTPKGAIYPCHTIMAAETLCQLGYAQDPRIQTTFAHLLDTRYADGGWRCNKFSFGRGPETECSNPLPTLAALDAFRFDPSHRDDPELSGAVGFLLRHWEIRRPVGPCHYGIGTLFMQVSYPFRDYNLFLYVYVLSFYAQARADHRFQEALKALGDSTQNGQIVVQRVVPKLARLSFCEKGKPSALATRRYQEILDRMG